VTHQASDNSQELFYTTTDDGTNWSPDIKAPNVYLNASPAMAVSQDDQGNDKLLYVVHQGAKFFKGQLWYTTFDGTNWSTDTPISNISMTNSPSIAFFWGLLWVAYQNTAPGNSQTIWCTRYDGKTWSSPFSIGESEIYQSSSPCIWLNPEETALWLEYYGKTGGYQQSVVAADGKVLPEQVGTNTF
jgi:hypothetical protein